MDDTTATRALSALAQPTRLSAFRVMVAAYPEPLPAGEIARRLAVPHNTLSNHLAVLSRAGLVWSGRTGRTIAYGASLESVAALVAFLVDDCCAGRTELCGPLALQIVATQTPENCHE